MNTLKRTMKVGRLDGSDKHSFPSGHTATAFMTATMFNKEYGHKSPWIGIGAYTTLRITVTGLMRMANNKHWLSDVLTGVEIGILSAEMDYYFADLIFKEKGINRFADRGRFDRLAWREPIFYPYVGVGGRFAVSSTSIVVNENEALDPTFDALLLSVGSYFSYPLSVRWLVGCKFWGEYVYYLQFNLPEKPVSARNGMGF